MQTHINVIVFKRRDRGKPKSAGKKGGPFYVAQWKDPLTGKTKRQSTKTAIKGEALTIAKQLETDLNAGRRANYGTSWNEFRLRYETEIGRTKAKSTLRMILYAFNAVDRIIGPKFLRSVTAGELSTLTSKLRDEGLAEATLASILRTLKASLRWAASLDLIPKAPKITMPHNANRKAGGRAVTVEEFERMLDAVPKVLSGDIGPVAEGEAPRKPKSVTPEAIASWRFLLRGLWWSGLRLGEAMRLHWTDDRFVTIKLGKGRPLFLIKPEANKSRKDQSFPMAREFAQMLESIPDDQREGFVFNPQTHTGYRCEFFKVSRIIALFGRKANVSVSRDAKGNPLYASAHDLRRSFGTRWSREVLPQVLKDLMRHTSIQTTMDFYITQSAEDSADIAWKASEAAEARRSVVTLSVTSESAVPTK